MFTLPVVRILGVQELVEMEKRKENGGQCMSKMSVGFSRSNRATCTGLVLAPIYCYSLYGSLILRVWLGQLHLIALHNEIQGSRRAGSISMYRHKNIRLGKDSNPWLTLLAIGSSAYSIQEQNKLLPWTFCFRINGEQRMCLPLWSSLHVSQIEDGPFKMYSDGNTGSGPVSIL